MPDASQPGSLDLYRPEFVRGLFDEMAKSYGVVNLISSFGFCRRWRHQCTAGADLQPGQAVIDLMSGMGELWPSIAARTQTGSIVAIDLSPVMCQRAAPTAQRLRTPVAIKEEDALANSLAAGSADAVVSSFGLKTFSPEQRVQLAQEVARLLRPGGRFSFLEISVPPAALLRWPYLFYINYLIPLIGRLMLGNPENYRLLGVYTQAFGDCRQFAEACTAVGLHAQAVRYFFGCATGVVGHKPAVQS